MNIKKISIKIISSRLAFGLLAIVPTVLFFATSDAWAANRYWISGANSNWNNTANWSTASGGAGGASVPGAADDVIFDGGTGGTTADGNCTVDVPVDVISITSTSAYGGALTNSANDQSVSLSGSGTFSGGSLSMGDATWTVAGNFTITGATGFSADGSNLTMTGAGKTFSHSGYAAGLLILNSLTISGTVQTAHSFSIGELIFITNTLSVTGTLTVSADSLIVGYSGSSDIRVAVGGRITGGGFVLVAESGASISQQDGTFDVAGLFFQNFIGTLDPAQYASSIVKFYAAADLGGAYTLTLSGGTYTFTGDISFVNEHATDSMTVDNSANNPNLVMQSSVEINDDGGGAFTWTKGSGSITLSGGAGTNTIDFDGEAVEDLVVNAVGIVKELTDNVTTDSLTITAGSLTQSTTGTPTLTTAGAVTVGAAGTWTNNGLGDLVLGGDVANAGTISFNSSDAANGISITSSSSPTQRNWQGAGTFNLTDVSAQDQNATGGTPAKIYAYSSTGVSNNTNWHFPSFTQNDWRWYVDSDNENVTDPWGSTDISENTSITVTPATLQPPASATELRLRMNVTASDNIPASFKALKLQYGAGDTCTAVSAWTDIDASGGAGIWRYAASSVSDQAALSASKLGATNVRASYAKSNPTIVNPNGATAGQNEEWDFHIQNNGALSLTSYCFRAIVSDDTVFDAYNADGYPRLVTKSDTANQMRHGDVFVGGSDQGFTFAD